MSHLTLTNCDMCHGSESIFWIALEFSNMFRVLALVALFFFYGF